MKTTKLPVATKESEKGGSSRRRFLAGATAAVGAAQLGIATWEQPKLFSEEVRAGFRSLRGAKPTALNQ